jgi:hypothetical protein
MKYKFWNIVSTDIYTPYAGAAGNVLSKRYSRTCISYQDFLDNETVEQRVPSGKVEVIISKVARFPPCSKEIKKKSAKFHGISFRQIYILHMQVLQEMCYI